MKSTAEIGGMVGTVTEERIVAGKYGNTFFTENGFVIADPCYVLDDQQYRVLLATRYARTEINRNDWLSGWVALPFEEQVVYCRDTGGDGSYFGCCVDSGWIIVMPESLYRKAEVAA